MTDQKKNDEVVFVSNDSRQTKKEQSIIVGDGKGIVITTAEQLMEMAKMARSRKEGFDAVAKAKMTRERALRIKELRRTESWRVVAGTTYREWPFDEADEWYPPTNQLMGMALCEAAAAFLGEDAAEWDKEVQ